MAAFAAWMAVALFVATAAAAPPAITPEQFKSLANDDQQPAGDQAVAAPDGPSTGPAESPALVCQRNDARLNDIAFIDPLRGWAVGDAGAIWHTADGGQHWQPQSSGVDCRLMSVCFIDADNGIAAGGQTEPYTHLTRGVLLRTGDGGQHWSQDKKLLLPALRGVRFVNAKRGWAFGASSALYPSGLFVTDNGGRDWTPLAAPELFDCTAGGFCDAAGGAVASREGALLAIGRRQAQPAAAPPLGLAAARKIQFASATAGWLVGDGGLMLATDDGGRNWHAPLGQLDPRLIRPFDFTAVAVRGPRIWIAGSPGSRVFHSPDGGRTWNAFATGQSAPIGAIAFADDLHGWTAGALGQIQATDDGGRTWHRQRAGAERVALMGIFSQPADVPLEMLARESQANGFLSVVELLNRRDLEVASPAGASLADRTDEALVAIGVQGTQWAWQFPLRQPGLEMPARQTTAIWNQTAGGNGVEELEARLVREIRMWRPSVVVMCDASDRSASPARQLIERAVSSAIEHAADPEFDRQGLPAWQVQRLFAALPPGQIGSVNINTSQWSPRLGRSLPELTWGPRGLLLDQFAPAAEMVSFRLGHSRLGDDETTGDFFAGLNLRAGDARRELGQPTADGLGALRRAALQRRNLQAILKQAPQGPPPEGWLAQVTSLTAGMQPTSAGEILFQLGQRYISAGEPDAAAEAMELLAMQFPGHPLTPAAQRWLVQHYASSVARGRPVEVGVIQASAQAPADAPPEAAESLSASTEAAARAHRAIQWAQRIERSEPALFAEPEVRLPLAAAYRRLGMAAEADHALASLRGRPHDAWWQCAEEENWLAQARGPSPATVGPKNAGPKREWHCAFAAERPQLDGVLDDVGWQHAEPVAMYSAQHDDADWPAAAMLARDRQFLYLAVRCRQAAGVDYSATKEVRPRQADLSARDHVDLILSPDRDDTTYYRLSIDDRGWVNAGGWEGAAWQPTCYVAAATHDGVWSIEAAIPWSQLTDRTPKAELQQAWGANIQRTVPGVGFQSWSTPAAIEIRPEGMGILSFDPPAAPPTNSASHHPDDHQPARQ